MLRWESRPAAREYKVLIVDQDGREVWQASAGTRTEIPVPLTLQPGRVYFWQVEAFVGDEPARRSQAGFWLVDENSWQAVERIERAYGDSALILAATYMQYGLYEEASIQVARLEKLNPQSASVRGMRSYLDGRLGRRP
jgi:hypothetical protein